MKVVSWNIAFGANAGLAARELSAIPSLSGADIVLLQEMDDASTREFAGRLDADYGFRAAAVHRRSGREFGNAIVSRWPITDVTEISLPHVATVGGQPRSATRARVQVGGVDVIAYSVHTEVPLLRLARRNEQFASVSADAVAPAGDVGGSTMMVVGGDFNTVTRRGVRRLTETLQTVDLARVTAGAGPTMTRLGRSLELDHIFARHAIVTGCGVAAQATASDHGPLWVTLEPT